MVALCGSAQADQRDTLEHDLVASGEVQTWISDREMPSRVIWESHVLCHGHIYEPVKIRPYSMTFAVGHLAIRIFTRPERSPISIRYVALRGRPKFSVLVIWARPPSQSPATQPRAAAP